MSVPSAGFQGPPKSHPKRSTFASTNVQRFIREFLDGPPCELVHPTCGTREDTMLLMTCRTVRADLASLGDLTERGGLHHRLFKLHRHRLPASHETGLRSRRPAARKRHVRGMERASLRANQRPQPEAKAKDAPPLVSEFCSLSGAGVAVLQLAAWRPFPALNSERRAHAVLRQSADLADAGANRAAPPDAPACRKHVPPEVAFCGRVYGTKRADCVTLNNFPVSQKLELPKPLKRFLPWPLRPARPGFVGLTKR